MQGEPHLVADVYRNQSNVHPQRRIEKNLDFIEFSEDGILYLGTSNLTGRIWSGSVWAFNEPSLAPECGKSSAGTEIDSGVCDAKALDDNKIIVGTDTGALHILSLTEITDKKSYYFSTTGIICEHDDSVVTLDVLDTKAASGSLDMSIKVWDTNLLVCEKEYNPAHGHIVTSVSAQQENDNLLVSTSLDGTSLLWDIRLDRPASLLAKCESGYTSSSWTDDNCVALGATSGSIELIDKRVKSVLFTDNCSIRPVHKMKFRRNLNLLAVCADDPVVTVYNCEKNSLENIYRSERHQDFVRGLAWDPASDTLYSSGWDTQVLSHCF